VKTLAQILSVILGPQVWLPLIFILVIMHTEYSLRNWQIVLPLLFVLQIVVPLAVPYIAYKLGKISDWDIPERKDRPKFLVVSIISWVLSLFIIYYLGNKLLFDLNITMFLLLLVLSVIMLFWKISIHASLNTVGALLINFLYGWQLPILYLSIPLVVWARLILKRHTWGQLSAGVIVSTLIFLGSLKALGLL